MRDAAHTLGKSVDFVMEGREIELDRSLLDEIGEPLVHLLRNAVDHGVERPEVRVRAGKPARFRFRARVRNADGWRPLRSALVRFAGKRARTGRRGRATIVSVRFASARARRWLRMK